MARRGSDHEQAIYVISVAAELAGVHPQTLRVYERRGLVQPSRTSGNTRRYSEKDIDQLRKIQELTNEGINLAGVERILELEARVAKLQRMQERLLAELDQMEARLNEALDARTSVSLVPLKEVRRIRRVLRADAMDRAGQRRVFTVGPVEE